MTSMPTTAHLCLIKADGKSALSPDYCYNTHEAIRGQADYMPFLLIGQSYLVQPIAAPWR